ncbi:MAG: 3'-5' exonuclease [Myxococcota bacterium]
MSLGGLLRSLRASGESIAVVDLARRIAAMDSPPPPELARRLVAVALDWGEERLPDRLSPDDLREPAARRVADIPIETADFAVVDLETTGLSEKTCEIIEIGAVRIRGLEIADEFVSFVRPEANIPERITRLTGIRGEMVCDAPGIAEALADFRRWLDATPAAPFVAHNASFDARFVAAGLARCGLPALAVPILCTRRLGRRLAPEVGRYNLDHLAAHFGYTNHARHRAAGDARVTARILIDLLHRAVEASVSSLGSLLDLQDQRPGRGVVPSSAGGKKR